MGFGRKSGGDFPFLVDLWYLYRAPWREPTQWRCLYPTALALHLIETIGKANMAKAIWNGQTIAESDKVETVEGNIYFPEEAVNRAFLKPSSTSSNCPWKGQASVLHGAGRWPGEPGCGVVLPESEAGREDGAASCGVLAWCGDRPQLVVSFL